MEWYRSAGVGLFSKAGGSLLSDPWIHDGALLGSWYHWPPLGGFEKERLLTHPWDAVYVSHLHGDHFDRRFLAKLAKLNDNVHIIIASFAHQWLKRSLERLGFAGRIIEASPNNSVEVAPGIDMTVFTADHCNPALCGSNISCVSPLDWNRAIDSFALIAIDGLRVINANDAATVTSSPELFKHLAPIDLLLTAYSGASPYPQAFTDLSASEKRQAGKAKADTFLSKVAQVSTDLKAKRLFPFAGQHVLGGRLSGLNEFRGMYSLNESARVLSRLQEASVFTLQPFRRVDPTDCSHQDLSFLEPSASEQASYLRDIGNRTFPYERRDISRIDAHTHTSSLVRSMEHVAKKYEATGWTKQKSLVVGSDLGAVTINLDGRRTSVAPGTRSMFDETRIWADPRLLHSIVTHRSEYAGFTDAHMNVADGGNHLEWSRSGEYDPQVTSLLWHL